ncbi:MAG TPA: lipopolysaccharide kinase InaA family protein [Longimicrobiales bacterium]|nr:lipopolysaccharide kinase InaA family protein [Longimicrobiales bacterium]
MRLPSGYEAGVVAGTMFVARQGLGDFVRGAIESDGSLSAFAAAHAVESREGRGPVHVIDSPLARLAVRHYRRGGLIAPVLGDRYVRIGAPRPFHELWINAIGRARGIPTPAVAAAVVHPAGMFYRGDLATDYIPDATTLADVTFGEARLDAEARRNAWWAAGRLVRATALAGLVHADLNLRNVLVAMRSGRPLTYLLDLDRCRIAGRVSARELNRMKTRIRQSASKLEERTGETIGAEFDAFEEGASG